MSNEDFYQEEAEYWAKEAQRLKDLLLEIANKAWHRNYTTLPPEPPIGTKYFHGASATWERTADGWVCSNPACKHCPDDWSDAWEHGIDRTDTRVLP